MRAPCAERKREKEKRLSEGKGKGYLERSRAHDGGHPARRERESYETKIDYVRVKW